MISNSCGWKSWRPRGRQLFVGRTLFITILIGLVMFLSPKSGGQVMKPEFHRSPVDLVLLPGSRALTANYTANTVSLVDIKPGTVLAEVRVAKKPVTMPGSRSATQPPFT